MTIYNKGPCGCCGDPPEVDCCTSCPCPGMNLFIEVEGPFFAGNYTAIWEVTPGKPWTHAWVFELDGDDDCGTIEVRCRVNGGNVIFDMWRNAIGGGSDVTVICGEPSPITIEENTCTWFSAPGNNTLVTITFDCWYPEYFTLDTPFEDDGCDCSIAEGTEIPINCPGTTPNSVIYYRKDNPFPCQGSLYFFDVAWLCDDSTGQPTLRMAVVPLDENPIGVVRYELPGVTYSQFLTGGPFTLTRTEHFPNGGCIYPASIQITGHNNGNWCS